MELLQSFTSRRVSPSPTTFLRPPLLLQQQQHCLLPSFSLPPPPQLFCTHQHQPQLDTQAPTQSERGVHFSVGDSFFRSESSVGRDLAVLAAAIYKKQHGQLRVLDAMCGCGVRAVRYLVQAQADFVLANDAAAFLHPTIVHNLSRYRYQAISNEAVGPSFLPIGGASGGIRSCQENGSVSSECLHDNAQQTKDGNVSAGSGGVGYRFAGGREQEENNNFTYSHSPTEQGKWLVTNEEANKLLLRCYLKKDFFDFIDVDSFGSESTFIGSALSAIRHGGLLYLTSTDGFSAGGHGPHNVLAAYGSFVRPMPFANELGLRMLIGGAVREAALRKVKVWPVFSLYSSHGPVFRVLLRVTPGKPSRNMHYGFIGYCSKCGDSRFVHWEDLGGTACSCSLQKVSLSVKLSGPLWTGPLHTSEDIKGMAALAREWGWFQPTSEHDEHTVCRLTISGRAGNSPGKLSELLDLMLDESHPDLAVGYLKLDEIAKRGKIPTPPRSKMIRLLKDKGYVASRSHIEPSAVKTNCSMSQCINLARSISSDAQ